MAARWERLLLVQRSQEQTDVARFFPFNPPVMYRDALCRLLDAEPTSLARTTRLFALIDAAVANAMIETFRLKFEIGFWRPFEAIATVDDGNPATEPEAGWAPLVPNPAYSEYPSPDLGRPALPGCHGRRLRPRAPHRAGRGCGVRLTACSHGNTARPLRGAARVRDGPSPGTSARAGLEEISIAMAPR